jgi:hypothetical protein
LNSPQGITWGASRNARHFVSLRRLHFTFPADPPEQIRFSQMISVETVAHSQVLAFFFMVSEISRISLQR